MDQGRTEKMRCESCRADAFEKWTGNSGLTGWRCINQCWSSYVIDTIYIPVFQFPADEEEEKRQERRIRRKHEK